MARSTCLIIRPVHARYRRRVLASLTRCAHPGVLTRSPAAFVAWVLVRSVQVAQAPQSWPLAGIVVAGWP